jgi:hypothetical protein
MFSKLFQQLEEKVKLSEKDKKRYIHFFFEIKNYEKTILLKKTITATI